MYDFYKKVKQKLRVDRLALLVMDPFESKFEKTIHDEAIFETLKKVLSLLAKFEAVFIGTAYASGATTTVASFF